MSELLILPDANALTQAACTRVMACISESVRARGRCMLALSGGSTPRDLYRQLATHPQLPWHAVHLCFGDERSVPPDDPRSNARMVHEVLTSEPFIPPTHVHRMRGELPPEQAARQYAEELRGLFPGEAIPRFDLVLLGLGPDGHTASLFPHSKALDERDAWVVSNWVESQQTMRITLTFPVLNAARACLFLVSGRDKAPAVQAVLERKTSLAELPAIGVQPTDGILVFMLDEPSAAGLGNP